MARPSSLWLGDGDPAASQPISTSPENPRVTSAIDLVHRKPAPHMATDRGCEPEELCATPGVICSPELTVGTSPLGNVFSLLLLPYGFLSFCRCIMTICLCLSFEAVMWLLAPWGFCKELPRCARWDKAAQCKGASQ